MDKLTLEMLLNARHDQNAITLFLINAIPAKGFSAVPHASKGRTVAAQLEHMNRVRLGWIYTIIGPVHGIFQPKEQL